MTSTPATVRLTTGQALVRFLARQWTERDGRRQRMFAGCFGIFGHGNVAGLGQGLLQAHLEAVDAGFTGPEPGPDELPYLLARNEQGMVHAAVGYARSENRLRMYACTSSIGPGATNMVTGAALATIDRIPVLLLPGDVFASRRPDPVLQQLEHPGGPDVTVNDTLRPVSRFFDRIWRPEQLLTSALQAMRVLTDPAETGAVTLCLPQDVQAEAFDWPVEFFADRVWHVARPVPEPAALERAVAAIRSARRPLLLAGGGVVYSEAADALRELATATGIPVADTHAGKGAINWDHPCAVGGLGATGASSANALAGSADLVIGVGTRYTDFTTASNSVFGPGTRFVNLNVAAVDSAKLAAEPVVADAREGLIALTAALTGYRTEDAYQSEVAELVAAARRHTDECYDRGHGPLPAQTEVFGVMNRTMAPEDVVINAAGSMPGQLQQLWRASVPGAYHVEYGFSCMGYEIPAAMGVALSRPDVQVVAVVGDGTYQMMPQELATVISEGIKIVVVLLQNHGFASIGALSESTGSQRFGTRYRMRSGTGQLDGGTVPVDLALNAQSLGADVLRATTVEEFAEAFATALAAERTTVVHVETDPVGPGPDATAWWDVPVSEVSTLATTQRARARYEQDRQRQRRPL
ncbi:3D-(3,5/4)-trihydroxycyclohexane-1,2-dione acylhydrolase (decyclizing) [Auraticoccus sp. F435]|uniref:3D-(3,5/4)-trihydroxycyclohexane-1,2-dione acylhydrolase (Decyclizing) n=1 Tax=Auraticoccus cholistanensis TaxID=2656650 RepID=A0A6A9V1I9_9ACTN|nr:3D-(3,5/4)-trihydroxycyclohexane-1,2-dione acylhydrolase (decyclizing) [Auraticoccus cholistanensis]MVA77190.1 3D-(3,5/4)-trihydroxycyclohexane-1,2-dione acylhydrolase (decyclizing) [Auraticoccus cholistanensis]